MSELKTEYLSVQALYRRMLDEVKRAISKLVEEKNIDLFNIEGRVKTFESLESKISKKPHVNSFNDIEDLCGIRVICYYLSDLNLIGEIISDEFVVLSSSDKQKEIEDDRFGYSSRHFIVKLKDEWLSTPLLRGLEDLKIEIQVRTMLMHSWAAISHKLLYKHEDDAPREVKRNLSKLSALIELADEQFDTIKDMKIEYQSTYTPSDGKKTINEPLNSDNLLSLISMYSPNRKVDNDKIPMLLEEIKRFDQSASEFEQRILKCLPYIDQMESEEAEYNDSSSLPMWNTSGFCRTILDLTCDDYFNSRWGSDMSGISEITSKYRSLIND